MTIDMSQFYQVFFDEASEHLANMEALLLALDVHAPALEDLNAIFRAAHSIKGGSGTFGFTDMTAVTHILETLLDKLRKEELALTPAMVDAFLATGDVLRAQLQHHQGGPDADEGMVRDVCARLSTLSSGEAAAPAEEQAPAQPQPAHMWLECSLPAQLAENAQAVANLLASLEEVAACEIQQRPGPGQPKLALSLTTTLSDAEVRDLLAFYVAADAIHVGAEAPVGMAALPGEEAFGLFEDAPGAPAAGEDEGFGLFSDAPGAPPAATEEDAGFGLFSDAPGAPSTATAMPSPSAAVVEEAGFGLFIDAPGAPSATAATPVTPPLSQAIAPPQGATSHGRRTTDQPGVEVARAGRRDNDKQVVSASSEASSIRVAVEKVDQLINLVGELVITQAMLAQSASILDPVQAEQLLTGIDLLSRNTRDLQESVMSIRMLPMSMVFSRFPRVVRDVAGKLGKQVEMRTIGENTELDKGLIEKISDPLTHLVRNSLDHGIETPEKRVAAGKSPKGTLTLKASHQGGNIVIEVMDDGAGLNRDKILAKARERGLAVHDGMSDAEVWQLIYAPGFSTADQITDVSGRGVGMDVVKRNIESLGGRVDMESSLGFGTRTIISLPLTLAILDGMSVGVGGETYIVPLTLVVESLQPRTEDIRTIAGQGRVVSIRGEYLPLIPLAEVFNLPDAIDDPSRGILMVIEAEGGRAALFVDELLGQHQVVIKSLESNYRKVAGVSGATIMGDGRVALILDIAAVTRMGMQINRGRYGTLGLAA